MSQEHNDPIYRTSPARMGRMMAIMLGICIAGGAIFFGMWDYWISEPPPVVALMAGEEAPPEEEVELTGVEIDVALSFIESSDFRTLAFDALPGEPGSNPTITAEIGDRIKFDVINDGVSFHSFGVTAAEEGLTGIIPGTEIRTATNPLKGGESGTSEFIPSEEGVFYYICTVPGHRQQGMVGQIIVGDAEASVEAAAGTSAEEAMTEGLSAGEAELSEPVMEATQPTEEMAEAGSSMEEPAEPGPAAEESTETPPMEETVVREAPPAESSEAGFAGTVSLPAGSSLPGCDEDNMCYIPADVSISVGETVTWSNDDTAAHTVTSGLPAEGPDGHFDSSLFMAGTTFDVTFDTAGEYPYYCIVHPWMKGSVTVS